MVGIQGIGGVPEPRPDRPAGVRDDKKSPPAESKSSDGVVISSEAQAAAVVAKSIQAVQGQGDIRTDRVEEAREALDRGDHQKPDVVATVAERISKFL